MARTQKAKGVLNGLPILFEDFRDMKYFFAQREHILIDKCPTDMYYNLPSFVRPCPLRPRHGFIESRVVRDNNELTKLWKEVRKIDKRGELLLGPYIKGVKYNSIYVNSGLLSVGPGNAGATGGIGSISFPVASTKFGPYLVNTAGLNKKDTLYIEAVCAKTDTICDNDNYTGYPFGKTIWMPTQIRGGPKVEAAYEDYIPYKIIVKEIVTPCNDLLQWEKSVKKFKKGTVVYGNGHTLASHAAIHCILNKVPFIISKKPIIGQVLEKVNDSSHPILRNSFKRGIRAGTMLCKSMCSDDMPKLFSFSLSVLHNWAYLKNSEYAGLLLGSACAIYMFLCAALLSGEYRHYRKENRTYQDRYEIYNKSLSSNTNIFNKFGQMVFDFSDTANWQSGFGGTPWATCALYSAVLWNKVSNVCVKKNAILSDDEIKNIIGAINKSVNTAHNNGWWFNKITSKSLMDFVAKTPGLGAFCVADVYFNIIKHAKRVRTGVIVKTKSLNKGPYIESKDGDLIWAKVYTGFGDSFKITVYKNDKRAFNKTFDLPENKKTLKFIRKYSYESIYPINKNFTISIPGYGNVNIKNKITCK
jgi:hypothetical protein